MPSKNNKTRSSFIICYYCEWSKSAEILARALNTRTVYKLNIWCGFSGCRTAAGRLIELLLAIKSSVCLWHVILDALKLKVFVNVSAENMIETFFRLGINMRCPIVIAVDQCLVIQGDGITSLVEWSMWCLEYVYISLTAQPFNY